MKITLPNIPYRDYYMLSGDEKHQYNAALRHGTFEPVDIFEIGDYTELTFGRIKDIQFELNTVGISWDFIMDQIAAIKSIEIKDVAASGIFHLQQARMHMRDAIDFISNMEAANLGHRPSPEEVAAGIDMFEEFGVYSQYRTLTKGDLTKIDAIEKLPYNLCFTELKYLAKENIFIKNLHKQKK